MTTQLPEGASWACTCYALGQYDSVDKSNCRRCNPKGPHMPKFKFLPMSPQERRLLALARAYDAAFGTPDQDVAEARLLLAARRLPKKAATDV